MKWISALILFCLLSKLDFAQSSFSDSGVFIIHKFAQAIGKEKYTVRKNRELVIYSVAFKYIDRGFPVNLTDSICFTKDLEPVSYRIKGATSRFSQINDSVVFEGQSALIKVNDSSYTKSLKGLNFPVAGYSPGTAQMLLIKYWNNHHFPDFISTPPFGSVRIFKDGTDTMVHQGSPVLFTRYHITGLVWGNELIWTNSEGALVCLMTNDAEGDKQEIVDEKYETLLQEFIKKAAVQGMQLFTKEAKPSVTKHLLIAIVHGSLIDVVKKTMMPDMTILVENGKIKKIGKSTEIKVSSDAYTIDANGKTILPGLWDMHAHFEQAEWGPAYLAAGVTTVRDCGNEFEYINAVKHSIDDGSGIGPFILKAGIIDGKGLFSLGVIQADNKAEAIAAVQRYKENGFVQIKVYSSVKPAVLKEICLEAHRLGLTITGHIPDGMNLEQAVDSGMDMVNHVQYVYSILKINKTDGSIDFNDPANISVMKFLKDHHIIIDPTLGVFELAFRSVKDSITDIEPNFSSLPEPLKQLFINFGTSNPEQILRWRKIMQSFTEVVGALNKNQIRIVAGTDMGFPGYSVFRELELYVASGLSPIEAIQTATIVPASTMKMESTSGSLETGKNADIILVEGNPLQDIRNIRNVKVVIRNGVIYDPGTLNTIAGFQ